MSQEIRDLLPKRLSNVEVYDPRRTPIEFDLSDNTSQWGIADEVQAVLKRLSSDSSVNLSRYPDIYALELKKVIAKHYSKFVDDTSNVVVGNGTDDVLDCIIRAVTDENDLVVMPMPTFPMAGYFSKVNGRRVTGSELDSDGSINVEEISSYKPDLIYLCSPNNPTGVSIPHSNIAELIEKTNCFIVIDEAYAEFAELDALDFLRRCKRVIIMRTMSKLHGLAGLRIGYALGNGDLINAVEAIRGPFKANTIGIEAAKASFGARDFHEQVVTETRRVRDWFSMELRFLGYQIEDSDSNFIYVSGLDEEKFKPEFKKAGYSIRWFKELPVVGTGARITIAPKEVLEPMLEIIRKYS